MTFDPVLLMAMWAAGLAAAAAVVAFWRIVGPGFLWLTGGVAAGIGLAAAFASPFGIAAVVLCGAGVALARRQQFSAVPFGLAAVSFLVAAAGRDALFPVITGTVALGGITAEMMLGHWYLVDPRLPRWALRRLDVAGGLGVVADVAIAWARGAVRPPTDLFGAAFLALSVLTLLLAVGVWYSLKEEGYEGVMAATGLSYLATLTVLAVAFLARTPIDQLLG